MADERLKLEQQSDISSYIHYIKTMGGDESSLDDYPIEKERITARFLQVILREPEGFSMKFWVPYSSNQGSVLK